MRQQATESFPRVLGALLCALALAAATPAASARAGEVPLTARLAQALAVPNVNHRRSAAVVVDLEAGRVIFARNPDVPLAPASTEKLALSFALLTTLGPVHRIQTHVVGRGGLQGGTWRGDLILKGHGDPTLSTGDLRALARRLLTLGIRRVTGSVLGDESFFDLRRTAPGWKSWYYNDQSAPLSALAVDHALHRGAVSSEPALAAASAFRRVLVEAGIAVTGPYGLGRAPAGADPLAAVSSPPLLQVLRLVNRESDNFTAELLLKHLGAVELGSGTTAAGAVVVTRALRDGGIPTAGVRFVDGSGLSLLDRLTADSLVAILVNAWRDPLLRGSFLSSLAVAGRNGTLERRLTHGPATGRVFAKTGTTSRSSALTGYVAGRYAFAVLQNGPPLSTWWSRTAQDRFVTVLARQ